jgi:hypothetical protein
VPRRRPYARLRVLSRPAVRNDQLELLAAFDVSQPAHDGFARGAPAVLGEETAITHTRASQASMSRARTLDTPPSRGHRRLMDREIPRHFAVNAINTRVTHVSAVSRLALRHRRTISARLVNVHAQKVGLRNHGVLFSRFGATESGTCMVSQNQGDRGTRDESSRCNRLHHTLTSPLP